MCLRLVTLAAVVSALLALPPGTPPRTDAGEVPAARDAIERADRRPSLPPLDSLAFAKPKKKTHPKPKAEAAAAGDAPPGKSSEDQDSPAPKAGAGQDEAVESGGKRVVVSLAEPYERFCAGGGGRYLIFLYKTSKKLAVFDATEEKVVRTIDVPSEDVLFAASRDKLAIVLPAQKLIQRWNLKSLEREKMVSLPGDHAPRMAVMGYGGQGPLLLWLGGTTLLWDLEQMRPLPVAGKVLDGDAHFGFDVRVSADGRTFVGWTTGLSGQQFKVMALEGGVAGTAATPDGFSFNGMWAQPNADGTRLFTYEGTLYGFGLKRIAADSLKGTVLLASDDPRYFLSVRPGRDQKKSCDATVCAVAGCQPLFTVKELEPVCLSSLSTNWGYRHGQARIRYSPAAKLLLTLPESNDQVVVRHFDLQDELNKAGTDYVFVVSQPPPQVALGANFAYQIETLSKAGSWKCKLEQGPKGMTVSDTGEFRWKVTRRDGDSVSVIATVRDASGTEAIHTFDLAIVAPAAAKTTTPPKVAGTPRAVPKVESPRPESPRPERPVPEPARTRPKPTPPAGAPPGPWTPAQVATGTPAPEATLVELGGAADAVCAGAGGRLLLFTLKQQKQIVIVDVAAKRVVHSLPVSDADVMCAAGLEKFVLVLPTQKTMERWSLKTCEREKTGPAPGGGPLTRVMMGCAGAGPLLLLSGRETFLWDVDKMKVLSLKGKLLAAADIGGYDLRASADGQTFVGWTTGITGQHFSVMALDGPSTRLITTPDDYSYNGMWALPSADGSLLLIYDGTVYDGQMKKLSAAALKGSALLPTADPRYLLSVRAGAGGQTSDVSVCSTGGLESLSTITGLEPVCRSMLPTNWGHFAGEPRVRYLPQSKLLVTIPESNDRVAVRDFDLTAALRASGEDYLYVVSKPPARMALGTALTYQIETLAKGAGLKYKLESGPEGMTVSADGTVHWQAKQRPLGGTAHAIVRVTSAGGKSVSHTLEISVFRPIGTAAAGKPEAGSESASGFPQVDRHRLEIPAGSFELVPGRDGRTLLLHQAERLAVLGPDGLTIQKQHRFDKPYVRVAEREGYYVGVTAKPAAIDLIDKGSSAPRKSFKFNCLEPTDLALHPTKPYAYVAFKASFDVPSYQFIVYDEHSGEGRESEEYVGTWLALEPGGRWLIAGYRDIYESGSRLLVNPDRVHVLPEYGSIDQLRRYRLGAHGLPTLEQTKDKAGGNGQGLRLSRDGRRVTYLSHVGYPQFSGNLAGWDPTDLTKMPASYPVKDKATTYDLAYHPVLPLVASPGSGSAVFLDRETGEIQERRLNVADDELADSKLHRVYFSPDGKHVILDTSVNDVHYLFQAELRLTADELRRLATVAPAASAAADTGVSPVRTWSDATGKFRVEARFVGLDAGKVILQKADGNRIAVPLERLSPADRQFVDGARK